MTAGTAPRVLLAALLALAGAAAGCAAPDRWSEPVPGREVIVRLTPGAPPARANWPAAWRRGAVFEIRNETGAAVESVEIDLTAPGAPRELVRVTPLTREGVPVRFLHAPHGQFPLRALVGAPGSTLLLPGEAIAVRLDVLGDAGASLVVFRVPGVTPP